MPNSPDFDQLTSKEMQQINDACDQFESAWRQWQSGNEVPSITSAMTENQTSDQPSVTFRAAQCWALIEVDREARQEHGLPAERQDYLIVLPADLHHVLAHVDFAARSAPAGDPSEEPRGIRYRVVDTHARGGLGEVFIARDQELGRDVALKEIRGEYADDPDCRNRFLLEAEVTGSLEHQGIVPVYGLGRYEDGRPYYAMRLIKGQSLREVVNEFHGQSASEET